MAATTPLTNAAEGNGLGSPTEVSRQCAGFEVGLLTGGGDKPYAIGLSRALLSKSIRLDFIGSDDLDSPELHESPGLRFLNLRGNQRRNTGLLTKIKRISLYYARLIRYAAVAKPKIFHILWNNKFEIFDRTLLMLYYKSCGKNIVLTVHNVNAGKRDANDSLMNRLTLKIQYRLADHIFVHTEKMKNELLRDFSVSAETVSVIPFGINNAVPHTDLTRQEARRRLGLHENERAILFFGRISPYKGLHVLASAFRELAARNSNYRLVIAGLPNEGSEGYLDEVLRALRSDVSLGRTIERIEFIPDEETEVYFKAADVLVLPYTQVFLSGVLFLGYSFGLPAVATDVGSFTEDIVEGSTGFLCEPCNPSDLARAMEAYFESDLFKDLDSRRHEIRTRAEKKYSWNVVADKSCAVYAALLGRQQ
jgi:D-inositol-3-phosphate glycosyltransferase